MRKIFGCCGHDCSRCITYLATIKNDDTLRKQSQQFYKTMFGLDIPLDEVNCLGCQSNNVFKLCKNCLVGVAESEVEASDVCHLLNGVREHSG